MSKARIVIAYYGGYGDGLAAAEAIVFGAPMPLPRSATLLDRNCKPDDPDEIVGGQLPTSLSASEAS